jgi:hypothetical protein
LPLKYEKHKKSDGLSRVCRRCFDIVMNKKANESLETGVQFREPPQFCAPDAYGDCYRCKKGMGR